MASTPVFATWPDPAAKVVIARFGSHPIAGNAANDPTTLPAFDALAHYLMSRPAQRTP
ncbi:hypothetical protein [Stenotrophomonas sp. P5_B8]